MNQTKHVLFSDSSSSDGHPDSVFDSSSPISTPIAGHSSNRFIPVRRATAGDESLSQTSSLGSSLAESARSALEAREDEESGYARLEDVRPTKKEVAVSPIQQQQQQQQSFYR